ncbi:hypothetical protein [Actinophytocola sp.]|uniref:hypothetical protein n=1 Tax=Actinophytocola sp. TaxID=1872138 RepID=UPI00389ABCD6
MTAPRATRRRGRAGPSGILLPGPRAHVDSNVTRLLCAGVHVDPGFCDQVIEELLKQRNRCVAPSYGYDPVAVLAHALNARRRRRVRGLAMLGCLLPLASSVVSAGTLSVTLVLAAVWWAWMVVFVEQLVCAQTLVTRLKRPVGAPARGNAAPRRIAVPAHRSLPGRLPEIVADQHRSGVYYSGYVPFVGAGTLSRSWSFSVILRGALGPEPARPFTLDQLYAYVHQEVVDKLRARARPDGRIHGLKAERRLYRTALTESGADLPPFTRGPGGTDQYDSAREYLCVNIGSWAEELVTSIFVGFDLRGDTLHTELHSYVLLPIRAEFHEVDRLPAELAVSDVLMMAMSSPVTAVLNGFRALAAKINQLRPRRDPAVRRGAVATVSSIVVGLSFLPWSLFVLAYWWGLDVSETWLIGLGVAGLWAGLFAARVAWTAYQRNRVDVEHARRQRQTELAGSQGARIVDRGARNSIRDLAASDAPHHFFQKVDQDKYTKIVERRVTEFVVEFLRGHGVDVSEYETRQAAVLNFGIMNTGGGQVVSGGAMTAGVSTAVKTGT